MVMEIHKDNSPHVGAQENEENDDKRSDHTGTFPSRSATSQKGENGQECKNHNDNEKEAEKDRVFFVVLAQAGLNGKSQDAFAFFQHVNGTA